MRGSGGTAMRGQSHGRRFGGLTSPKVEDQETHTKARIINSYKNFNFSSFKAHMRLNPTTHTTAIPSMSLIHAFKILFYNPAIMAAILH